MALPAGLLLVLGKAAASSAVQSGAQRLVKDVYGRVMSTPEPSPPNAYDDAEIMAVLGDMATREKIAASFALLQAELDRRHRLTLSAVAAVFVLQLIVAAFLLSRS